jgi:hypothetical protein
MPSQLRPAWILLFALAVISTDAAAARMGFFVTSTSVDGSADLGGLDGADRHCQKLADAAGAGDREWRAYLSTGASGDAPGVDARTRIGQGPWHNAKGSMIARDLDELHSDRNRLDRFSALTEKGAAPKGNVHDILTGSDEQGRLAMVEGAAATCSNWSGDGDGVAAIGHHDRFDAGSWGNKRFNRWNGSWNAEHETIGCDAKRLAETGGGGLFYCFAADASAAPAASKRDGAKYSFKRGLNINHWLGDNLDPKLYANSLYGEPWFDAEDVGWIAAQGFDHLRIRVGGHYWIDKNGDLDSARLRHFDDALRWAKTNRLGVVLTMVSLPGFKAHIRGGEAPTDVSSPFTDEATRGDAAYLWWLVARRYADTGEQLRFEVLNGPDATDTEQMRSFNREMLAAIRRTNPTRMVYLTTRDMSIDSVADVELPDPYTAFAVQFWEPELFTFQINERIPRLTFPGRVPELKDLLDAGDPALQYANTEMDVATLDARIAAFAARIGGLSKSHEIYIADWGVLQSADDDSAGRYIAAARAAFERHGLSWAIYDYHSGCAVRGAGGKATRILRALAL